MDIDELKAEQAAWSVLWRWEGSSGHPRRMADTFAQALEKLGFSVDIAETPLREGGLENVAEFEGVIIARTHQSRLRPFGRSGLRRSWACSFSRWWWGYS